MFEKASRLKIRFPYKGSVTTEDLWDLTIKELDSIFKTLNAQAKVSKEESLLDTKTKEDEVVDLQISIIRHVVEIKKQEIEAKKTASERAEKKQKLLEILDEKRNADLKNKSAEDLEKMIAEL